jgi:hypothetical protein
MKMTDLKGSNPQSGKYSREEFIQELSRMVIKGSLKASEVDALIASYDAQASALGGMGDCSSGPPMKLDHK